MIFNAIRFTLFDNRFYGCMGHWMLIADRSRLCNSKDLYMNCSRFKVEISRLCIKNFRSPDNGSNKINCGFNIKLTFLVVK